MINAKINIEDMDPALLQSKEGGGGGFAKKGEVLYASLIISILANWVPESRLEYQIQQPHIRLGTCFRTLDDSYQSIDVKSQNHS